MTLAQQTPTKSPALLALLDGVSETYPAALEEKYIRILENIIAMWDSPDRLLPYFDELLVDKRGVRVGFPKEVGKDIFALTNAYDKYLRQKSRPVSSDVGHALREIEVELRREFIPREFYKAIERNEFEVVCQYVRAGIDINAVADAGMTPLLIAVFNGREEIAKYLIENGATYKVVDRAGNSPLHWAAFNGLHWVCEFLLDKGMSPDISTSWGLTPLLQASKRGHVEVVKLLLDRGANVNRTDAEGSSALHKAVANKEQAVVTLLLQRGADPQAKHKNGATPLSLAKGKGLHDIARQLAN